MLYLFGVFGDLSRNEQLVYGLMVMAGIFGFTSVMDQRRWSWIWEALRSLVGLYLVYTQGNWFGLNEYWNSGWLFVGFYFVLNLIWVAYFCFFEFSKDK